MRINTYRTYLTDDFTNVLVKEKSFNYPGAKHFKDAVTVVKMMKEVFHLDKMAEEYLYMIAMNTKCYPIGVFELTHGTVNQSFVSTRDILVKALLCGAVTLIIIHNHPSQDCKPSMSDINTTKRIQKGCELVGIELLDHIIIGKNHYSFKEHNEL